MIPKLATKNEPRVSVLADAVYRALAPMNYGTLVTYDDLRKILFEDPQAHRGRAAILRAGRRMLRENCKLLVNVRTKGYQIAQPNEQAGESRRFQEHADRRLRRALATVVNVEMAKLEPQERQEIEHEANRVRLKLALTRTLTRAKELPTRKTLALPSGKELAELLRRGKKKDDESDE